MVTTRGNPPGQTTVYRIKPSLLLLYTLVPVVIGIVVYVWLAARPPHQFSVLLYLFWLGLDTFRFWPLLVFFEIMIILAGWRFSVTLSPSQVSWTTLFGKTITAANNEVMISEFHGTNASSVQISKLGMYSRKLPMGIEGREELLKELRKRIAASTANPQTNPTTPPPFRLP